MKRIKELREAKGLTGKDLANRVGVTPAAMSLYESGKREPSFGVLARIAEALHTTCDYLMENTDAPAPFDWAGADGEILTQITTLTPNEKERVLAFIAGIKAGRR